MAKKMHKIELMEILRGLISGEVFEDLGDERDTEQLYLIGSAFEQVGSEIKSAAKEQLMTAYRGIRGEQIDGRLIIKYTADSTQTRINSAAVRSAYPKTEHPQFYSESQTRESLTIKIGQRTSPTRRQPPAVEETDGIPY